MVNIRELFKSRKFIFLFSMLLGLVSIVISNTFTYLPDNQIGFLIFPILGLLWGPFAILGFVLVEFIYLIILHPKNIAIAISVVIILFISNFAIWKLWYSVMNRYGYEIPSLNSLYNLIKLFILFFMYPLIFNVLFYSLTSIGFKPHFDWTLFFATVFKYCLGLFVIDVVNNFKIPIYTPKRQFKQILPEKGFHVILILIVVVGLVYYLTSFNQVLILIILLTVVYLLKPYKEDVFKIKDCIDVSLFGKVTISIFFVMALILIFTTLPFNIFFYSNLEYVLIGLLDNSLLMFLLLSVPVLIYMYFIEKKVTNPINKLSETLSKGIHNYDDYIEHKNALESIKLKNEIKTLVDTLLDMEKNLLVYGENLVQVTSEKERFETELKLAHDIQNSMIPTDFEEFCKDFNDSSDRENNHDFEVWGLMKPAREIGGDFYDYFKIDEDNVGFVIGDVSGKGVTAALVMVEAMTLIQNYIIQHDDLSDVFYEVNNQLSEGNVENIFVTCWLGKINLKTGQLSFVNAGHNKPLIRMNNNDFEYLETSPELVLGIMEDMPYETHTIQLNKADAVFLYTDGVTEANDDYNGFYGEERLQNVLNKHKDDDLSVVIGSIEKDISEFCNHGEIFDDTTMIIVRIK
ncbi:hypothetical protein TL18_00060 [Methanobrevibacter sp. YE315]|uniref:SpoIIE family protein phosphatase n=1 Tax=Methanobrevibacter sp. YE315 TaxID=1609968 RepID=UPI000764E2F8|nr:PP2C family protein-serine/threonine phosphatase [Methanobrevibacter sp. YE315]AMD16566.1 hypothetical protein TL18_00060 [Methanobrevibacter sp. YE315]